MIFRIMLLGVVAAFTTSVANAEVYLDSVDVVGANVGVDGAPGRTVLGQSFNAPIPGFTSVSLELKALTPTDNGSVLVYLVPDDGTGGAPGVAGMPEYLTSGGLFSGFRNAQPIGAIADASLSSTPSLVSLAVGASTIAAVAANTSDGEYWLALVLTGSSGKWEFNSGNPAGLGTAGQAFFNNPSGAPSIGPDSAGAYEAIVATEPMTIAILGVGILGLGYIRCRRVMRA